jgi:2-dehydropantoate 2-reductase
MRILLFGAGAMSCLFAARLARVAQITLVDTWPEAVETIRARGIVYEDSQGTQRVRVEAQSPDTDSDPVDLALVLVKSWQTPWVARVLPKFLNPGGFALSLQNGLGNVEMLGPQARPGTTSEGATLVNAGHVLAGGSGPTHVVAPDWVVDLMRAAGFEAYACSAEEARNLLWSKLCVSCGINALTALLRVPNGELLRRPPAENLMIRAALECAAVAGAAGIRLRFEDAAAQVKQVAEKTAGNKSSMLQDILRGAPTECDAINGAVVREGRRVGVATPVNEILWQMIQSAAYPYRSVL